MDTATGLVTEASSVDRKEEAAGVAGGWGPVAAVTMSAFPWSQQRNNWPDSQVLLS